MFPLVSHVEWSVATDLAIALVLGLGFGFCLERAGFGSARKLTAVFYLFDMAVVKVMFTAIVTCMTGIALLSAIGAVDISEFYVEPTALPAQILGGLLFGAGFMVGGYCPGTSMAAIATGRKDGFAFAGGFLAAYGAKIAKGCTSGQALTGGAILNVGSLVFMVSVFAAAYGLAWFVRKEWI